MRNEGLAGSFGRSLLHYYVALKLSAGAIAPLGLPVHLDAPPPIVRRNRQRLGEWDPREIIVVGDQVAVLTVSAHHEPDSGRQVFHTLN